MRVRCCEVYLAGALIAWELLWGGDSQNIRVWEGSLAPSGGAGRDALGERLGAFAATFDARDTPDEMSSSSLVHARAADAADAADAAAAALGLPTSRATVYSAASLGRHREVNARAFPSPFPSPADTAVSSQGRASPSRHDLKPSPYTVTYKASAVGQPVDAHHHHHHNAGTSESAGVADSAPASTTSMAMTDVTEPARRADTRERASTLTSGEFAVPERAARDREPKAHAKTGGGENIPNHHRIATAEEAGASPEAVAAAAISEEEARRIEKEIIAQYEVGSDDCGLRCLREKPFRTMHGWLFVDVVQQTYQ